MAWGCISKYGFHDFILLDGKMNSDDYIQVLKDNLLPVISSYFHGQPFIFQQDGASIHTAGKVKHFLKTTNIQVLEWPPQSRDFSIIEHVWHYLKEIMKKLPVAGSKQELWSHVEVAVQHMWTLELTQKINELYESLPNRMHAVITAHGGNTTY